MMLSSVASIGIHRQRHLQRAPLHLAAEVASGLQRDVPRRRRKEHEPHHVGARVERRIKRLARGQAADFDEQGHDSGCWFEARGSRQIAAGKPGFRCGASTTSRAACLARRARKGRARRAPGDAANRAWRRPPGPGDRRARPGRNGPRPRSGAPARRQRRWPNQVATPPATTPRIAIRMSSTNSGSETDSAGSAELKGSNDTVTKCRLATANTTNSRPSGITISAVRNFRITLRLESCLRPHQAATLAGLSPTFASICRAGSG